MFVVSGMLFILSLIFFISGFKANRKSNKLGQLRMVWDYRDSLYKIQRFEYKSSYDKKSVYKDYTTIYEDKNGSKALGILKELKDKEHLINE